MKSQKKAPTLIAAATLSLLAVSQQALAKDGLIDMQKVYQSPVVHNMMTSGTSDTKALQAAYQDYQALNAKANKAKGKDKKTLETKVNVAKTKFQHLMAKQQAAAHAKQAKIQTTVSNAIATVSKKDKLHTTLIKQAVLYYAPGTYKDITDEVVATLGK